MQLIVSFFSISGEVKILFIIYKTVVSSVLTPILKVSFGLVFL